MPSFTYQVGTGDVATGNLKVVAHSVKIVMATFGAARAKAETKLANEPAWELANVARLLDDHGMTVWFRPIKGAP